CRARLPCQVDDSRSALFYVTAAATPPIYTLSLHDALPISPASAPGHRWIVHAGVIHLDRVHPGIDHAPALKQIVLAVFRAVDARSEEHTSELQSRENLVCRLLLEKKKQTRHLYLGQHRSLR